MELRIPSTVDTAGIKKNHFTTSLMENYHVHPALSYPGCDIAAPATTELVTSLMTQHDSVRS